MSLADVKLNLVDDLDGANEFMRWLGSVDAQDALCVDTETTGLDRRHDKVRLIQFGSRTTGWAIPWDDWRGLALTALSRYEGRIKMFNAKYDVGIIESNSTYRFDRAHVDDVMIKAHIDDPSGRHGLKALAAQRVDAKAVAAQRQLDAGMEANKWNWATVPIDFTPYWVYGAMDTVLTMQLDDTYPDVPPAAYDLEMAATWITMRMEDNGVRVDIPYTETQVASLEAYLDQAYAWCMTNYGVRPGSDLKVIQRLQEDGIVFTKQTPSGNRYALDKEVLEAIEHPLAATVLQRRRVDKLTGTYLKNFISMSDADGILHPQIHPMMTEQGGARTGRMSISNPSLQNLPRRSDANPLSILVRNCFVAREGNLLVLCDFDQIEARMVAHFAGDDGMIAAFSEGDFFTNIARMIYADPSIVKKDPRRQWTKNAIYAIAYGAGVEKFAQTAGIAIDIAQAMWDAIHRMFPGIKRFQREVESIATQRLATEGRAYVQSPLTKRYHVAKERKEYALVNYLIQGTASEVFKMKLLELDAQGLGGYMVLPVHDEIILDVPAEDAQDVAHAVSATMADTSLFKVPLTAGVDVVDRWESKGA